MAAFTAAFSITAPASAKPLSDHVEMNKQFNDLMEVMMYAKAEDLPDNTCSLAKTAHEEHELIKEKVLQLIQDSLRAMEEQYPEERARPIYEDLGTAIRIQNEVSVTLGAAIRMCIEYNQHAEAKEPLAE